MSSEHVFIHRSDLLELARNAAYRDTDASNRAVDNARAILSAPSPEMVPMSDLVELTSSLEVIARRSYDRNAVAIASQALAASNVKFKA